MSWVCFPQWTVGQGYLCWLYALFSPLHWCVWLSKNKIALLTELKLDLSDKLPINEHEAFTGLSLASCKKWNLLSAIPASPFSTGLSAESHCGSTSQELHFICGLGLERKRTVVLRICTDTVWAGLHLQTCSLKSAILLKWKQTYQILFVVVFEGFWGWMFLCLGFLLWIVRVHLPKLPFLFIFLAVSLLFWVLIYKITSCSNFPIVRTSLACFFLCL